MESVKPRGKVHVAWGFAVPIIHEIVLAHGLTYSANLLTNVVEDHERYDGAVNYCPKAITANRGTSENWTSYSMLFRGSVDLGVKFFSIELSGTTIGRSNVRQPFHPRVPTSNQLWN